MQEREDLTGRLFGRLVVLYEGQRDKHGKPQWCCECQCGNRKLIGHRPLLIGSTVSCGCFRSEQPGLRVEDLVGQTFGRLTVTARDWPKTKGKSWWVCRCICGAEKSINRRSLLSGDTTSCGCYRRERSAARAAAREYVPKESAVLGRLEKTCSRCRELKPIGDYPKNVTAPDGHGGYCRPCHNVVGRENRRKNHGTRGYHLKRRYGITQEDFDRLVEGQNGLCAICQKPPSGQKPWQVDHDHSSGKVRGILCHSCNTALGNFNDSVEVLRRALEYLKSMEIIMESKLEKLWNEGRLMINASYNPDRRTALLVLVATKPGVEVGFGDTLATVPFDAHDFFAKHQGEVGVFYDVESGTPIGPKENPKVDLIVANHLVSLTRADHYRIPEIVKEVARQLSESRKELA